MYTYMPAYSVQNICADVCTYLSTIHVCIFHKPTFICINIKFNLQETIKYSKLARLFPRQNQTNINSTEKKNSNFFLTQEAKSKSTYKHTQVQDIQMFLPIVSSETFACLHKA